MGIAGLTWPAWPATISGQTSIAMQEPILFLDPEVKPPEFRVPRGRSGIGAQSALETLLSDLERIRKAKEAYKQLFQASSRR
jgi:hypothetical protein